MPKNGNVHVFLFVVVFGWLLQFWTNPWHFLDWPCKVTIASSRWELLDAEVFSVKRDLGQIAVAIDPLKGSSLVFLPIHLLGGYHFGPIQQLCHSFVPIILVRGAWHMNKTQKWAWHPKSFRQSPKSRFSLLKNKILCSNDPLIVEKTRLPFPGRRLWAEWLVLDIQGVLNGAWWTSMGL